MHRFTVLLCLLAMVGVLLISTPRLCAQDEPSVRLLVFTKTAGFRHQSIADGVAALQTLSVQHNFSMVHSEDSGIMTDAGLEVFDVVVFLSTTGNILNNDQQGAFERFIQGGGGFVGIHAASDTEYDWPWYGRLVGAYFSNHPQIQDADVLVEDQTHPSTVMLPAVWPRRDEWYNFRTNPRTDATIEARILATLDETTYTGGTMPDDHPIMWCHEFHGGRSWYHAGGHTRESFSEPLFLEALVGGIQWAAAKDDDLRKPVEAGPAGE